jgi:hypothetical protein
MGRKEIIEKLDTFISTHSPITEECHAVYLMVEIRKILDQEKCEDFPLLRFYCNWTVHTDKYITPEMKTLMEEIYKDIKELILNPALAKQDSAPNRFAYMENLKAEMKRFLEARSIDASITEGNNWIEFIGLLVKILEDQPIKNPTADIIVFSFIPAAARCVQFIVEFKKPISTNHWYKFGNAY